VSDSTSSTKANMKCPRRCAGAHIPTHRRGPFIVAVSCAIRLRSFPRPLPSSTTFPSGQRPRLAKFRACDADGGNSSWRRMRLPREPEIGNSRFLLVDTLTRTGVFGIRNRRLLLPSRFQRPRARQPARLSPQYSVPQRCGSVCVKR
jgi:hypothetical protein